jgi:hypothetical protein
MLKELKLSKDNTVMTRWDYGTLRQGIDALGLPLAEFYDRLSTQALTWTQYATLIVYSIVRHDYDVSIDRAWELLDTSELGPDKQLHFLLEAMNEMSPDTEDAEKKKMVKPKLKIPSSKVGTNSKK